MTSTNKIHRCLVLLVLILWTPLSACSQSDARLDSAKALVHGFFEDANLPGLSVAVGLKGDVIFSEGVGYADLEQKVPVWPAITRFRIGSVAKPMTAVAIGQLVEKGLLDLDAPVQQYVSSFPEKQGIVTTRLLAGHLAGIRHYRGEEFLSLRFYPTVEEGLTIFQDDPLINEPGTSYSYSSYGWNLISAVIENASGVNFLDYMDERVFGKMGMNATTADVVRDIISNRTRYYETSNGRFYNSPPVDNSYKWAGGGFLSTAEDLVRFGFAHVYSEILNPETVDLLWTSQKTIDGEETGYGIGWFTGTNEDGKRFVGHGGGSIGGITYFRVYPDDELVVVIITNASQARFGDLPVDLANLFMSGE